MNFGPSARDYAKHRQGLPDAFFDRVPLQGLVVDLGAGTGNLARGYTQRGAQVVLLEPSAAMLAEAPDQPLRLVARAEACPLRGGRFDAVTAGQCWHWFDGPVVARECRRLLRPGGQLVIAHFNYLPLPGSVAEASERLILERNPRWGMAGVEHMSGRWDGVVREAGFVGLRSLAEEVDVAWTHERWRGRMRACNGVIALGAGRLAEFDAALAERLRAFPEPLVVRHEVFALIARAPSQP